MKAFNQYSVHPEQFLNVQTAEVAYILGMIWADGHLAGKAGQSTLVLLTQQADDMRDIAKTLDKTGRWRYNPKPVGTNEQPSIIANISNKVIATHLAKHGYKGKSTGSATAILETIPMHLKHYFFRGVFDGDGNLFLRKKSEENGFDKGWCIASDYEQDWSYMEKLFEELNAEYKICRTISKKEKETGRRNRGSVFVVRRDRDIRRIMEYIYQGRENDGIGLERKWKDWCEYRKSRLSSGNKYYGICQVADGKWRAEIPKGWGLKKALYLGRFVSEREAYETQTRRVKELGLSLKRERFWGLKNRTV